MPVHGLPCLPAPALLAEDNHVNRMYAQEVLRQGGVECHAVENGLQAIQAVQGERFDLVLMDCQMPEMDGFEATRRIREMECGGQLAGHLPVIALTANAIKGDREHCLEAGMDNYIGKPFEPDALLEMMGRLLAAKEGQPAEKPPVEPGQTPLAADRPPPINRDALLARCMGNLELRRACCRISRETCRSELIRSPSESTMTTPGPPLNQPMR